MSEHTVPRFLNLGCGAVFSPSSEWLNVDIAPVCSDHSVHQYALSLGIPFPDNSFAGVYHSHLLEHFPRELAVPFLRECFRVLQPGGVLRVAVPDLENILRCYLATLEEARQRLPGAEDRLLWMQVELLDQLVRRQSGGCMASAWQTASETTAQFIRSRTGHELDAIPRTPQPGPLALPEKALRLSRTDTAFLDGGECHQWMYDELSLAALLSEVGFVDIRVVPHNESAIPGFTLDSSPDGSARKPDSLYMEACRPQATSSAAPAVALFSTTDSGGAGIAALRLHEGLREQGVPSITYVQYKNHGTAQVYVLPPSSADRIAADGQGGAALASTVQERKRQHTALAAYPQRPPDSEFFSTSEAGGRLVEVPFLAESDIIHLHWIAGFVDVPGNADFLRGKKIVWTLHDMNPFTGGCHYAGDCDKYLTQCGSCPQLGSDNARDLSCQTWKRKEYAYRKLDITVVTPSRWLAEEARRSSLMGRFPVHCIPYGLPLDIFRPYPQAEVRKALGIPHDSRVLLFSADGVLNRRKGLTYLLEALNLLNKSTSEKPLLAIMGGQGEHLRSLPYPIKLLGRISNPHVMASIYSAADVLVLPTLEDNLPNVLLESLACGTPAVSFAVGGVPDIIDHGETGWLAPVRDVQGLAQCLHTALTDDVPTRRRLCRARAMEKYSLSLQATQYIKLYQTLLSSR